MRRVFARAARRTVCKEPDPSPTRGRSLPVAPMRAVVSLMVRRLRCGRGISVRRPLRVAGRPDCVVERRPKARPAVREVVREVRGARIRVQREPLWEALNGQ